MSVTGSVGGAAFESAACDPGGECFGVVVASDSALATGHAAELGGPDNDGIVEHAECFEIFEEGCGGLVHGGTHFAMVLGDVFV